MDKLKNDEYGYWLVLFSLLSVIFCASIVLDIIRDFGDANLIMAELVQLILRSATLYFLCRRNSIFRYTYILEFALYGISVVKYLLETRNYSFYLLPGVIPYIIWIVYFFRSIHVKKLVGLYTEVNSSSDTECSLNRDEENSAYVEVNDTENKGVTNLSAKDTHTKSSQVVETSKMAESLSQTTTCKTLDSKIYQYCKLCGSKLDNNRKCTGCGKQYFHVSKNALLKGYSICLTVSFIGVSCWGIYNMYLNNNFVKRAEQAEEQVNEIKEILDNSKISDLPPFIRQSKIYLFSENKYIDNPSPNPTYDELTTTEIVEKLASSYITQYNSLLEFLDENLDLIESNSQLESDLEYLSSHAAFVTAEGNKYHKYNCYHLKNRTYWIYNVEAAKIRGYTACADCWE